MNVLPLCILPAPNDNFSHAIKISGDQLIYVESGIRQLLNAFKHVKDHDLVLHLNTFFFKKQFKVR